MRHPRREFARNIKRARPRASSAPLARRARRKRTPISREFSETSIARRVHRRPRDATRRSRARDSRTKRTNLFSSARSIVARDRRASASVRASARDDRRRARDGSSSKNRHLGLTRRVLTRHGKCFATHRRGYRRARDAGTRDFRSASAARTFSATLPRRLRKITDVAATSGRLRRRIKEMFAFAPESRTCSGCASRATGVRDAWRRIAPFESPPRVWTTLDRRRARCRVQSSTNS